MIDGMWKRWTIGLMEWCGRFGRKDGGPQGELMLTAWCNYLWISDYFYVAVCQKMDESTFASIGDKFRASKYAYQNDVLSTQYGLPPYISHDL